MITTLFVLKLFCTMMTVYVLLGYISLMWRFVTGTPEKRELHWNRISGTLQTQASTIAVLGTAAYYL